MAKGSLANAETLGKNLLTSRAVEQNQCKAILIIEDDQSIRETLKFFLEFEGYTVFTASNGKEGLDALPTISKPCVIFLDLMMPIMDGWGFVAAIGNNAMFSGIPIIVLTAFADRAKTIRAQGTMIKPINLDHLLEVVKKYCG